MIGRTLIAPYELPIELIVGVLGSLMFIGLMFKRLGYGRKRPVRNTGELKGGAGACTQ